MVTDSYGSQQSSGKGDFGSHLSSMTGVPIDRVTEGGGGARVPAILARNSAELLDGRQVVIWLFTARYLPDRMGWEPAVTIND